MRQIRVRAWTWGHEGAKIMLCRRTVDSNIQPVHWNALIVTLRDVVTGVGGRAVLCSGKITQYALSFHHGFVFHLSVGNLEQCAICNFPILMR